MPAIVRRLQGNPDCIYAVICGARRHWTVSWMRVNNYPEFKFLVEPRELTDEEAFRIADLGNRNRRDLGDYERACDYARAVDRYYDGSQQRMLSGWKSASAGSAVIRKLAKLPAEVVAAFGSALVTGISHGAALGRCFACRSRESGSSPTPH